VPLAKASSEPSDSDSPQAEPITQEKTDKPESQSATQAQLAWLLAQLANVSQTNAPAVPVDEAGAGPGAAVHSTAVADLSRLVGARALVATTAGTGGTPTPQATNEVAESNVQAQEFPVVLTGTSLQAIPSEPTVAVTTGALHGDRLVAQAGTEAEPRSDSTGLLAASPVIPAATRTQSERATVVPGANEWKDGMLPTQAETETPSADTTEIGAAENQVGRGVLVRNQSAPAPRQAKVETGQAGADRLAGESILADSASAVFAAGEGTEQQLETEDHESRLADRLQWRQGNEGRPVEIRNDGSQVSSFTIAGQESSARETASAKASQTAAAVPIDLELPAKPAGTPTIRLEVSPPDMGRVQLRVSVSDHAVYTNVTTDQAGVRDLLLRQQDRLQDALGAYGLGMGSFNVEVGHQGQQRSEWGGQPDQRALARLAADVPKPDSQPVSSTGWDDRGLNLFA
jgi:flagellar hook-length control protein FliK